MQFSEILKFPDSEVVFYYLRLLDLNNIELTRTIVELIYQIFRMKKNLLGAFNDLYFINGHNVNNLSDYNNI